MMPHLTDEGFLYQEIKFAIDQHLKDRPELRKVMEATDWYAEWYSHWDYLDNYINDRNKKAFDLLVSRNERLRDAYMAYGKSQRRSK